MKFPHFAYLHGFENHTLFQIDQNAQAGHMTDTMGAIFNKDQSHRKQMKWETKRLKKKK